MHASIWDVVSYYQWSYSYITINTHLVHTLIPYWPQRSQLIYLFEGYKYTSIILKCLFRSNRTLSNGEIVYHKCTFLSNLVVHTYNILSNFRPHLLYSPRTISTYSHIPHRFSVSSALLSTFLNTTITQRRNNTHHIITLGTNMIRRLCTIHNQWYPTRRPE